ncbi:MAG TPA: hypothetical protein DEH78_27610 [Solibacterales bacterium]|nr:hypothetical protein [Bryobacterales bacterium]
MEGPIGLVFFNGAGERLAKAALDESGVLGFEGEYAECAEAARRPAGSAGQPSWTDCFDRLSRWIPRWGREVRAVEVTLPGCGPVRVETRLGRSSGDWWLWWVPLPHVGGTPYSTYSLLLEVKARQCQARALTPAGG